MRSQWFQSLKRFIEKYGPGDTEYTEDGIRMVFQRGGGFIIPRSEYPKVIAQMLEEREKSLQWAKDRAARREHGN